MRARAGAEGSACNLKATGWDGMESRLLVYLLVSDGGTPFRRRAPPLFFGVGLT